MTDITRTETFVSWVARHKNLPDAEIRLLKIWYRQYKDWLKRQRAQR